MEALARYNSILTSVYATDNAYRATTYGLALALLYGVVDPNSDRGKSLADLRGKIGDARFLNRLYVGTSASLQGLLAGGEPLDTVMALSMVLYHPLEHLYVSSTLKPALFKTIDGLWCVKWSTRMWLLYVLCDLLGTVKKLGAVNAALAAKASTKLERDRRNLILWLSCIFADFFLAVQWSVDVGPFSDSTIAWAGFYGGVAGLWLRWLRASDAARDAKESKSA